MQLSFIKNVKMHTFQNIQYIWVNYICQHLRIWSENVPMVVRNTIWFIYVFSIKNHVQHLNVDQCFVLLETLILQYLPNSQKSWDILMPVQ